MALKLHRMTTAAALCALALLRRAPAARAEATDPGAVEQALAEQARLVSERCGARIEASVDWRSFPGKDVLGRYSVSGFCAPPLVALRRLCADPGPREAVQRRVRRVLCRYGGSDGRGRAVRLRGGTIEWALDLAAVGNELYAREALRRHLQ